MKWGVRHKYIYIYIYRRIGPDPWISEFRAFGVSLQALSSSLHAGTAKRGQWPEPRKAFAWPLATAGDHSLRRIGQNLGVAVVVDSATLYYEAPKSGTLLTFSSLTRTPLIKEVAIHPLN